MNEYQVHILNIFKVVSSICKKHNIRYYAIGGTCIGAVRHKGFIPWDDDLDIAVPIEDYDRLKKLLIDELPPHLKYYDCKSSLHYHYVFSKVIDTRTTVIQNTVKHYKDAYIGVYIDIMPLSSIPSNPIFRMVHIAKIMTVFMLNIVRRFPLCSQNSITGKLASLVFKVPLSVFKFDKFSDIYIHELEKCPCKNSNNVAFSWSKQVFRNIFPYEWFSDTIEMQFEDTTIECPIDYDKYLKKHFGDYMIIPPLSQQKKHDSFVDLNHPFTDYQNDV